MNKQAERVIRKLQKMAREWRKRPAADGYDGVQYAAMYDAYRNAARIVREEFKEGKE